jgi:hypothetical protein
MWNQEEDETQHGYGLGFRKNEARESNPLSY